MPLKTKPQKIYFHGAGLETALGNGIEQNLAALKKEPIKPKKISFSHFDNPPSIPYFLIEQPGLDYGADRIYRIIDSVIKQALTESNFTQNQLDKLGLFIGSTSFDIYSAESFIKTSARTDIDILASIPPYPGLADYIAKTFTIGGPIYSFNTACTSSANALIYAAEFIRRGDIEHALVVGLEFFNEMTALGFWGLDLISKNGMKPFTDNRDGLYLGEGCGAIVLSAEANQHRFAYRGGANLGDNYSVTACNTDGSTIEAVINLALRQANVDSGDIQLVKAHGTASLSNDEAEAAGLHRVFSKVPPVIVVKPFIGHTLGAGGINELIVFYQSIINQQLPVCSDDIEPNNDFKLSLFGGEYSYSSGFYLLNYFGFGGNNTALIISND